MRMYQLLLTTIVLAGNVAADERNTGLYYGIDFNALKFNRWSIDNGSSGAAQLMLGWAPNDYLAIEGRRSVATMGDKLIDYRLRTDLDTLSGAYIKLHYPINHIRPFLVAGRTQARHTITVPEYQDPTFLDELLYLLWPEARVPDELGAFGPGQYRFDMDKITYGAGVEIKGDRISMTLEYQKVSDNDEWNWSIWSLGFRANF